MAAQLELRVGETVEKEQKGDYWEGGLLLRQRPGKYWFTNQRIVFQGGFGVGSALELDYTNIQSVELCNVGPTIRFLPTGLKVHTRDGNAYVLSLMKRKEILALIESKIR